jgi:hypothetical protein
MSVPFLLFVIAVLLVAIFWELCKIHSRIKKNLPTPTATEDQKPGSRREANEIVSAKTLD